VSAGQDEFEKLKDAGFTKHFQEYNVQLVKPFKVAPSVKELSGDKVKETVIGYIKCAPPPQGAKFGFTLFNVTGFWIGVAMSVFDLIKGEWLSLTWNVGLGYLFAYFFFWSILISTSKKYMQAACVMIALYVALCIFGVMMTLILVVPAVLYGVKGICAAMMLVNAFSLYRAKHGNTSLL